MKLEKVQQKENFILQNGVGIPKRTVIHML